MSNLAVLSPPRDQGIFYQVHFFKTERLAPNAKADLEMNQAFALRLLEVFDGHRFHLLG